MKNIYFRVRTEEQLTAIVEMGDVIICSAEMAELAKARSKAEIFADLPDISRENRSVQLEKYFKEAIQKADGIVVHSLDELGFLNMTGYTGALIADPFLYAYNDEAVKFYRDYFPQIRFVAPDELTDQELEGFAGSERLIYKIYGRQRVMFTAQDPVDTYLKNESASRLALRSVRGDEYVAVHEAFGYTTFYTGKPVSMLDRAEKIPWNNLLIDLTTETGKELEMLAADIRRCIPVKNEELKAAAVQASGRALGDHEPDRGHHYKGID